MNITEPARKFSLQKSERLCSQKTIAGLFKPGFFIKGHPIQLSYSYAESSSIFPAVQVLFVVSKKKIRTAVGRNRMKRIMRELYRLNKTALLELLEAKEKRIALAIIYNNHAVLPYTATLDGYLKVLQKLIKEIGAK